MIILYGFFAGGDWVRDLPYGYHSDTDIILKKGKYKIYTVLRLKDNIYIRLENTGIINPKQIIPYDSRISIILESIEEISRQLEKGRYFYTDIKKGILLYDSGEFILSEAKDLPWSEMKDIAKDYYEYWFGRGKGFLKGATTYLNDLEYAFYQPLPFIKLRKVFTVLFY
ncbi:nucleotidyltransferase/HEPN domain-containing protein [Rickettsia conorii subsp. heilongjiangensis 054]|nr:nucleotidyltransferase/HEPN domain-containing protein [Rickettsia conorii subsp. heilongjiangensis 054]